MIFDLMMLMWKLDDKFPFQTPFGWIGDLLEDYGFSTGKIGFSDNTLEAINSAREEFK